MLLASSWPPRVTASNTICRQKPERDADDHLLHGDDDALRPRSAATSAGVGNQRRDDQGDGARQHDADARRHRGWRRTPAPP